MTDSLHAPPSLLDARGLAFSRNDEAVFGPLEFAVNAGEALLVQGGNGAGKTTLLRVLAGLLHADAGQIRIGGKPAQAAQRSRFIAYLGHLPALKSDLSALENLEFLCGLHGRRQGQQPADALARVGLAGYQDNLVRQLSAGQKKRLMLARLWLSPAPLWLLDEPYANLDLEGINLVNQMITAHLHEGGAALVTTHGAYAAPPVRTRMLELGNREPAAENRTALDDAAQPEPSDLPLPATATPFLAAQALLGRDLRLLWQRRGDAFQPALFALLVVVLFALGLGGEARQLATSAGAVLWVAMLLAGLLALDTLFRGDAEDGSLEQWVLAPVPLAWLVAVRVFSHWLTTSLPLLLVTPLLAELLHLPHAQLPVLMGSLALGTPLLSLLGAVVAALTVGMRRSGILVALLALPLYVPVLVFGAGSVAARAQGLDPVGALMLLGAGLVLALVLAPLTAAAAIRIALN